MTTTPITDEELAFVRYIWSTDPPATEPVPHLLTDALRRIFESSNPVDTLRREYRSVVELTRRHDLEGSTDLEARK